jgi:uncharacterized protein (DUF2249 family)
MDPADDLIVDARGLDPPEPLERILDALARLEKGQRVRLRIHREPFPLYRILQQNDYAWQTTSDAEQGFEVLIWEPEQRNVP